MADESDAQLPVASEFRLMGLTGAGSDCRVTYQATELASPLTQGWITNRGLDHEFQIPPDR